jgi:glycosyl transferase family 25
MKTFVINLKKREDRKKHVEETYPKLPFIDMEIIQACDGKTPTNNTREINIEIIQFIQLMKCNNNNFGWFKYGELGTFISHLSIWKKMVNENIEKALIMEDDIMKFEDGFEPIIKEISLIENDKFHIVWLNYQNSNHCNSPTNLGENIYYGKHNMTQGYLGAYGYILSLQGAKYLTQFIEKRLKNKTVCGVDRFIAQSLSAIDSHYTSKKLIHTPIWNVLIKSGSTDISNTDIQIRTEKIKNITTYMNNINTLLK